LDRHFLFFDGGSVCQGVILDWIWWNEHGSQIEQWLIENNILRSGMILSFPSEEIKLLFILRWL
jgi:hypothetical protein